jgi:hypothetical protein
MKRKLDHTLYSRVVIDEQQRMHSSGDFGDGMATAARSSIEFALFAANRLDWPALSCKMLGTLVRSRRQSGNFFALPFRLTMKIFEIRSDARRQAALFL